MLTSPIHGVGKRRNIGVGDVCCTVGRNTVGDVGGNAGSNANIITATSAEVGDIDGNNKEMQKKGNAKSQNNVNINTAASAARRARRKERQQQRETKSCISKEL